MVIFDLGKAPSSDRTQPSIGWKWLARVWAPQSSSEEETWKGDALQAWLSWDEGWRDERWEAMAKRARSGDPARADAREELWRMWRE
eukprot:11895877-Alexandrium_andersonii.AAC.1